MIPLPERPCTPGEFVALFLAMAGYEAEVRLAREARRQILWSLDQEAARIGFLADDVVREVIRCRRG